MKYFQIHDKSGSPANCDVYNTKSEAEVERARLVEAYPSYAEDKGPVMVVCIDEVESRLYLTLAPPAYDGFGTREIARLDDGTRIVDIQASNEAWQTMRYGSGMHPYRRIEPLR